MNVLSLFDGMSCGQIALERANIKYKKYFASEIKESGIIVTQHNYPNTIQLGDVKKIKADALPKIDLFIGGSPCQDFSQANKVRGGLEGEKSGLFYEYARLLKELNPKYFLLENVNMKDSDKKIITDVMGVEPILIDSALVSAQNRKRLYWTNIPTTLPLNKNINLNDILDYGYSNLKKSRCLLESDSRPLKTESKIFHRYQKFLTVIFKDEQHYLNCKKHYNENYRGLSAKEITENNEIYKGLRLLSRRERERLQTVPEGYTDIVSENDAASLLGDGWTVDVIAHIFKGIL